jgi:hypothetical protein
MHGCCGYNSVTMPSSSSMWLWSVQRARLHKIFTDDNTVRQNWRELADYQDMAVQAIAVSGSMAQLTKNHVLIYTSYWDASSLVISPSVQIAMQRNDTLGNRIIHFFSFTHPSRLFGRFIPII